MKESDVFFAFSCLQPGHTFILCSPVIFMILRHSRPYIEKMNKLWNPGMACIRALQQPGCRILFLHRAAWQREEEATRDEGGYHGPTCPPHCRPKAFLFAFPSLRFRIPQIRIYAHIQPHPYAPAQPCGAMHPRCALTRHFLTDQS